MFGGLVGDPSLNNAHWVGPKFPRVSMQSATFEQLVASICRGGRDLSHNKAHAGSDRTSQRGASNQRLLSWSSLGHRKSTNSRQRVTGAAPAVWGRVVRPWRPHFSLYLWCNDFLVFVFARDHFPHEAVMALTNTALYYIADIWLKNMQLSI